MEKSQSVHEETENHYWRPRRFAHANMFIGSYERAAEFYRDIVGFAEVYRQPNNMAAFMSNGNTYHDLGLTDIHSRYCDPDQKPDTGPIQASEGIFNRFIFIVVGLVGWKKQYQKRQQGPDDPKCERHGPGIESFPLG